MNNFNSDQNQHILSSPETPEGGTSGINGQPNQDEQGEAESIRDGLEGQQNAETSPEKRDANIVVYKPENVIDALVQQEVEASKPKFEVGEDGLSLQGSKIQGIQSQIQQLESGKGDLVDSIRAKITESRQEEIENLEAEKFKLEGEKLDLEQKHTNLINQGYNNLLKKAPNTKKTLDEFTKDAMSTEAFSKEVEANKEILQEVELKIKTFDAKTQTLIETAIQDKKTELQQQLTEAQAGYAETGAEANDKKILLELGLQEQLTDPNQLFSEQNIDQIFATYGIKEGLAKLEALKQESDQAREQADRDEIQGEVFAYVNYYNNPELAKALSADIQTKLEALQKSNPDSETLSQALSLEGADKLAYLTNSGDHQLQGLAFWFDRDSNIEQVVAEYPQFAKYLDKETNTRYEQQKAQKTEFSQRKESELTQDINNRIAAQLERYRKTKVEELQGELSSLKFDENGRDYDIQDTAMLSEQEQVRSADIEEFRTELKIALESGQIKFEKGQFSALENIPEKQQEINKQLETIFNQIQPVLKATGYALQSLEFLSDIATNIKKDKEKADKKPLGFGKKQAEALAKLLEEVDKTILQYKQLQVAKQENSSQFENNNQSISKLRKSYQKLPQSIQSNLSSLENPNFETINQTIDAGVEAIQNYQTPTEIAEKRSQIQAIESEIAEIQSITYPQASTQS